MNTEEHIKEIVKRLEAIEKEKKPLFSKVGKKLEEKKTPIADRVTPAATLNLETVRPLEREAETLLGELVDTCVARLEELKAGLDGQASAEVRKESSDQLRKLKADLEGHRLSLEIHRLKTLYEPIDLFLGLRDNAWEGLVKFRRNHVVPAGKAFVYQGEYTAEFVLVVDGLVTVDRKQAGGDMVRLGTMGAGSWFGEMSALANQPAVATVEAAQPVVAIGIDQPLFKILYSQGPFKERIDAKYRERALAAHLRAAPILKGIPEESLLLLQDEAELVVFKELETIAKQGDEADALYLIRSGSVKCTHLVDGRERVVAYLQDNSSFGERAFASTPEEREFHVAFKTMERTDAVKLPRTLVEKIFEKHPEVLATIVATAEAIVAAEEGRLWGVFDILSDAENAGRLNRDRLKVMVRKQSVKGGEALVIDLNKCTRCNACVESCVAVHDDRVPRLSKTGTRISSDKVLTSACYNCETPGCMSKCNDGAIRRDIKGSIHFLWDNCTGCTACITGCPYGVIRMADIFPEQEGKKSPYGGKGFLEGIPFLGKLFANRGEGRHVSETVPLDPIGAGQVSARTGKAVKGIKAIKCDLCAGLPFEACVYNCPCGAIDRVNPEALFSGGE